MPILKSDFNVATAKEYIKEFLAKDDRALKAQKLGIDYNGLYPEFNSLMQGGSKVYNSQSRSVAWYAHSMVCKEGRVLLARNWTNGTAYNRATLLPDISVMIDYPAYAKKHERAYLLQLVRDRYPDRSFSDHAFEYVGDYMNYFSIEEFPPEPFKLVVRVSASAVP